MNTPTKSASTLSVIIFLVMLALNASADSEPFYTSNQSPLIMSYGIPAPESANILQQGEHKSGIWLAITNNADEGRAATETMTLDGETYNLTFRFRYGWSDRLQVGVDMSAIRHDGGQLDSFVENYHDWFGLPNGSRTKQPKDRLLYTYKQDGQTLLEVHDQESGFGDMRLSAIYQLKASADHQLAVRGGIKLPTGDADKLTGSNSTDVYLELISSLVPHFKNQSLALHSGLGLLHTGSGDVLEDIKEDYIPYGFATLAWAVSENTSLKMQLNGHGPVFDSDVPELNDTAIELVLGATARLSPNWMLDISLSEDVHGSSPPDFTVLLGIRYRVSALSE